MSTPTAALAADGIAPPAAVVVPKSRGTVKSVLSGDTLLIQDDKPSPQGPPAEFQVTLGSISAPRLARFKPGEDLKEKDEPFAWESREFLRNKCIGKKVLYTQQTTASKSTTRIYATVWLGTDTTECLNHTVISEGWGEVLRSASGKDKEAKEPLIALEDEAKAAGKGKWTKDKVKLDNSVRPNPAVDTNDLIGRLKNKPLSAIVERVITGSTLRLTLLPTHHNISVLLSGVQCPSLRGKSAAKSESEADASTTTSSSTTSSTTTTSSSSTTSSTTTQDKDGKDAAPADQPEPFSREAKFFVETNILNREVKLNLEGVEPGGSFFGSIECQSRDVAEELLKAGLAKYIPYSAAQRGQAWVVRLKAAEQSAKDAKRRIFANYEKKEATSNSSTPNEFVGKVSSVQNVGTLLVTLESGQEIPVNLSSLKLPRVGYAGDEKDLALMSAKEKAQYKFENTWAAEAKEWMRKRLIGQKVKCVFDNARKAPATTTPGATPLPDKCYYSVYWGDKLESNLAVALVDAGFAWVMQYKGGEQRSQDYEALLIGETKAAASHKGLHGAQDKAPTKRYNDLCVDARDKKARANQIAHAKTHVTFLQGKGPQKCIVDYVFSGARFKLTIPGQTCMLIFAISGLRVPRREEETQGEDDEQQQQKAAPGTKTISDEALAYSRERLHQRDASVEILSVDNGGNFVGNLFIGKKNYGVELLSNGYAYVQEGGGERIKEEFYNAEASAKKAQLRIWKDWNEEAEKKKLEDSKAAESSETTTSLDKSVKGEVLVTEVLDGARVYIQFINAESAGLDELVAKLTELSTSESSVSDVRPKVGDIVRAQFSEDKQWYRAKVTSVFGDSASVLYIDYGNSEKLPLNKLKPLPKAYTTLPPQAQEGILAFIKPLNPENDYARDAQDYLKELTHGKKLIAEVEYKEAGVLGLSLTSEEDGNINIAMVSGGYARLQRPRKWFFNSTLYKELKEEQEKAKRSRRSIWQYGDVYDSDEEESGSRRGGAPPTGKPAAKPAAGAAKPAAAAAAAKKK
eukprot:TRINITY_DN2685_c0_g2_i5.p1 TRINITY_DN2685_c0_g2~~TRINITY_DN2685_c0_g2_i5.p1  ORF type:complete len:1028 (-),score=381.77 TRINITY_DN2685_c0_g2_i5:46-3129(-)